MPLKYSSDQLIQIKCSYIIDKYKKKLKKLKDFKNELKLSFEKKSKAYYVDKYLLNKEKEELYKEFNKKKELELKSLERKKELYNSYFTDIFLYEQEYYQCIYKVFKNLLLKKEEIDEKEKHVIKLHEHAYMMFSDQNINKPLEKYNKKKRVNNTEKYNNKKNIDIDNLCNININEIYESIIHDDLDTDMYTYSNSNNYLCKSKKENYPNEKFSKINNVVPYFNEYVDSLNETCDGSAKNYEKNIDKKENTNVGSDYPENYYEYREQEKEKEKEEKIEPEIEVYIEKNKKEFDFKRKNSYEKEQVKAEEKEQNEKKEENGEEIKDTFFEYKEENNDDSKKWKENYMKKNERKKKEINYSKTEDIKKYINVYDDNKNEDENINEEINENKKKEYIIHKQKEKENDILNCFISSNNYEYIKNENGDKEILYNDESIENYTTTFDSNILNDQINKDIEESNIYTKKKDNEENERNENEELDEVIENNIIFNISSYFSGNYETNDNEKEDIILEEDNILNNANFDESKIKIEYDILKEDTLYKNDIIRNNSMPENIELNISHEEETNNFLKEYSKDCDEYKYINNLNESKGSESKEFQNFNNYKNENSVQIEKMNTLEDYAEEQVNIINMENSNNFMCIENNIEKKDSFKTNDRKKSELKNIQELINYMSHHIKKSNNT
ncbi:conserved Plasmodium protein, unknown function [Plasmodium relictum]|uniref:Uncharacterized protein n=1 Tax=Plasmodium relictum TaxID=85471 RepID=A0A1J1HCQ4_PLARL|nr:conserved Plasmodium protein, unknown function [Plasmodium relictum]CRH03699.1 conserved Plasmodium protein, unknown function [Plasmodium relictum]